MKRNLFLYCLPLLCLLFSGSVSNAQDDAAFRSAIDSLASIQLTKTGGIGFYIGLNIHGKEYKYYYGSSDPEKKVLPEQNSLYEIGPLSSTLTSILFSEMSIKGLVGYDDPVQKYLPFDVTAPVYREIVCKPLKDASTLSGLENDPAVRFTPYICLPDANSLPQPILLCYLATHTSGLPAFPHNIKSEREVWYGNYSQEKLYEFLRGYHLLKPISYDYRYSDLGVALLAHVLALDNLTAFDSLLYKRVLSPLEMTATGIYSAGSSESILNGYNASLQQQSTRSNKLFAPAGGFSSSINDMMKFLNSNLGMIKNEMKDILDYTHNPRILLVDSESDDSEIAMGWKIRKMGERETNVVWQGGSTEGFSSFLGFVETNKNGLVILSNSSVSVEELGFSVLGFLNKN
jgi:CubicO group peptidase (beta-lactamase class C family)